MSDAIGRQFVPFIYIGPDGLERLVPDVPTLAAYIRGGDVVAKTLIRNDATQPWRHGETDPIILALLTLGNPRSGGSNRAPTPKSNEGIRLVSKQSSRFSKIAFLFVAFLVAFIIALSVGVLYSFGITDSFTQSLINATITAPTALMIFNPAVLAVKDTHFQLGEKAKRFGLSFLLSALTLIVSQVICRLLLSAFPPPDLWSVIGLGIVITGFEMLIVFAGLKRLWKLSSALDAYACWRKGTFNQAPAPSWQQFSLIAALLVVGTWFVCRPDYSGGTGEGGRSVIFWLVALPTIIAAFSVVLSTMIIGLSRGFKSAFNRTDY